MSEHPFGYNWDNNLVTPAPLVTARGLPTTLERDEMADVSRPAEDRFWEKVDKTGPGGCWLWTAYLIPAGYGMFRPGGSAVPKVPAHRFAYELLVGPIPEGLHLDHLCRVRSCVNPDHLEPVTPAENVLRGVGPGATNARKTHCVNGHPFSGGNLVLWRKRRICRECRILAGRRRTARERSARSNG